MFPPLPTGDEAWALFLDFDGTLVEIAPTPDSVRVVEGLPGLLAALRDLLDGGLAVISGRPIAQIDHFFGGPIGAVAGLHGLERRRANGGVERAIPSDDLNTVRAGLLPLTAEHPGLLLEDKILSLALHYRLAPEQEAACRAAMESAMMAAPELELLTGKMVFEARPRGRHKGQAIAAFLQEPPFRGRIPVFLGDDRTDEDGFAFIADHGGIGIRVGQGPSRARYFLDDVPSVHDWLRAVAAALGQRGRPRDARPETAPSWGRCPDVG